MEYGGSDHIYRAVMWYRKRKYRMKKLSLVLAAAVLMAGSSFAGKADWGSYKFTKLSYTRTGDPQNINFSGSVVGYGEFLMLHSSHGNAGDVTEKQATVSGGGWTKVAYAGNDDCAIEIWFRMVTSSNKSSLGKLDSNNAKGSLAILQYKGSMSVGNVVNKKVLSASTIAITNKGTAPWLVVAAVDNGDKINYSTKANAMFRASIDDPTFVYITSSQSFTDTTCGKIRGGIASIELN